MKVTTKENFSGLQKVSEALGQRLETRVGILQGSGKRAGGQSNATLGAIHEFGSKTKGIPARSFLRMPLEKRSHLIKQAVMANRAKIARSLAEGDAEPIYRDLGIAAEAVIQSAFESNGFGSWAKNKPKTVASKKSSSPLIDTGQLRASVLSKVVQRNG